MGEPSVLRERLLVLSEPFMLSNDVEALISFYPAVKGVKHNPSAALPGPFSQLHIETPVNDQNESGPRFLVFKHSSRERLSKGGP
jgi:hypothetical protein